MEGLTENIIKNTTLCYIEKDGCYLMMLRNKKKNDLNQDKWVGVGGKFEEGESPEECLVREAYEETGLTLKNYKFRGVVTFISDKWGSENMHLYTADEYEGELKPVGISAENGRQVYACDEGELQWIPKSEVMSLNMWEGDRIFFELIFGDSPFFTMRLVYTGDELMFASTHIYE